MTDKQSLVIWYFVDGKPGHENQTQGLIQAISDIAEVKAFKINTVSHFQALKHMFKKTFPMDERLSPDLIIGAGHATHLSVLAAKKSQGGLSVILMKPSLPTGLFDLCIVPKHDKLKEGGSVVSTTGVLNRIVPSKALDENHGLILIGGPSSHYEWHDDAMIERLQIILDSNDMEWVMTTSRRTPKSFVQKLETLSRDNLTIHLAENTASEWLPEQLQRAGTVWVSEDSVSMVYEALTAGARCGILPVQRKQESRVSAGIDGLIEDRKLGSFESWMQKKKLRDNDQPLHEAARVAKLVCKRLIK